MKLQFGFEITWYTIHVIFFGYHFHFERKVPPKKMAQRIKEDGAPAVCLSILYQNQGWFSEAHKSGTKFRENGIISVPLPRRHGGKGRVPAGSTDMGQREFMFARNALSMFEFGTDNDQKVVGNGSQRDSETGESCYWPKRDPIQVPPLLDNGQDEVLQAIKPTKE